jgi:cobalt-precorrin 5A hydrolase / precorrin-3B C17-methyltransferase
MSPRHPLVLLAITARGAAAARVLQARLPDAILHLPTVLAEAAEIRDGAPRVVLFDDGPRAAVGRAFHEALDHPAASRLVLFMAVGAAVRLIAPFLRDKATDPAVVCVDETCRYAISLLSGHHGGANSLTREVADALGAEPVVTTASDRLGQPAVDLIGQEFGWRLEGVDGGVPPLTAAAAAVVNGRPVGLYQDAGEPNWWSGSLPSTMTRYESLEALCAAAPAAALVITDRVLDAWWDPCAGPLRLPEATVVYRPGVLVLGVGCRRGVPTDEILAHVHATLRAAGLAERNVRRLATADLKRDEPGLHGCAAALGVPITAYPSAALRAAAQRLLTPDHVSPHVERLAGTPAVSEPAALLAAGPGAVLVVPKRTAARVTCAVARVAPDLSRISPDERSGLRPVTDAAPQSADRPIGTPTGICHPDVAEGSLVVVGLGPGDLRLLPPLARAALQRAEVVVGYHGYLDLVAPLTAGKTCVGTGLGAEVERVAHAVDLALSGRHVALVSSGDAGVYGMAGLAYEVLEARGWQPDALPVAVVPGISAAQAAASLLGAPLMHDVATISLSDLLTPRDVIERRLEAAAAADFVVALYNPASRRRTELIAQARSILRAHRAGATPVGLVHNAYRDGQQVVVTTLDTMLDHPIDMLTIVIVGNASTRVVGTRIVTPRGYAGQYDLSRLTSTGPPTLQGRGPDGGQTHG